MSKRKKRFDNKKKAEAFAKSVDGQLNDLTKIPEANSNYSVSYLQSEKTKNHDRKKHIEKNIDMCPEEDRDFGYPNEYWN